MVSSKAFPQNRHYENAVVGALTNLLEQRGKLSEGEVVFLRRLEP